MSIQVDPAYKERVTKFIGSSAPVPTLGLVYGRRRIGKSTLLSSVTADTGGFYWEATRSAPAIQLRRLGEALGAHLGVGEIALADWEAALRQLLRLGEQATTPVVLDEFSYMLEADPSLDSVVASALGPAKRNRGAGTARLILCGSAIGMMRTLTAGEAPLRGRAGMELVMQPAGFREALSFLPASLDLLLASRVYAVIGGVVGYATDMVDYDLPDDIDDLSRWIVDRVLSPAATLHHEATTLLAEDPVLSTSPAVYHSILGAIANGSVTAGSIANRLRRSVSSLDAALKRLIAAGFVVRHADPVRDRRPLYALGDPFLQFHYAVLEPHGAMLRERDPAQAWKQRLAHTFLAQVVGPAFEEQARSWARRHADEVTLGGPPDHVGPTVVSIDGVEHQIDIVVASSGEPDRPPGERAVRAIGEVKASEMLDLEHLRTLEAARFALGAKAARAKLLLVSPNISGRLRDEASSRSDLELVDLERLYHGS